MVDPFANLCKNFDTFQNITETCSLGNSFSLHNNSIRFRSKPQSRYFMVLNT
jgi:hypothetical protein